jgi:hypothetical protein
MQSMSRVVKAVAISLGISWASLMPLFALHFIGPIFAPILGGFLAGEHLELTGKESAAIGVVLMMLFGLPAPIAQHAFGLLSSLSPLTVDFFSIVAALYFGGVIGLVSWFGGMYGARERPFA